MRAEVGVLSSNRVLIIHKRILQIKKIEEYIKDNWKIRVLLLEKLVTNMKREKLQ